jgi:plasmid stability protein
MASLNVRGIDEDTFRRLRIQAAMHGLSIEEEGCQILKRAVSTPECLGDLAVKLFSPAYGNDELILPERECHDPVNFE